VVELEVVCLLRFSAGFCGLYILVRVCVYILSANPRTWVVYFYRSVGSRLQISAQIIVLAVLIPSATVSTIRRCSATALLGELLRFETTDHARPCPNR